MKKIIQVLIFILFGNSAMSQWNDQNSGVTNDLNDVSFTSESTGWIVGRQGTLLTTSDGGSTWSAQNSGTTEDLNGIFMVSTSVGYAVGNKGNISKYNGSTWSAVNTGETRDVFGVHFVDANTGWAVGDWGRLYHTSNGGSSWTNQNNDALASYKYNDVHMLSSSEGWAVGTSGRIVKYDGSNWAAQTSGVSVELLGVHFLNSNFGFAVGKSSTILFYNGSTWSTQNSGLGNTSDNIYDVYIVSQTEAYAVVSPGFGGAGVILKYNGSTWSKEYEYSGLGTELFYGIDFPSASKGYAVGAGGMIKTKGTLSGIFSGVQKIASTNIFPNPTNGKFIIADKILNGSIIITNSVGEIIFKDEIIQQDHYQVDLSGYPKGIYQAQISDGNSYYMNKIVLE